ncbi:hypothetical protein [Flexilinea flocculi]|uniref:PsbP C-terminal domain-containing protein n=1 Tax=Flexilinea flocculi TaxID=1678840 RepID=A0A0S7BPI7_9CHLR|nr:hypothetical protein [Flexilinea flocculi]GAP40267.1 hypothetical protein ATC1_13235 [Flexilinea flocculi]
MKRIGIIYFEIILLISFVLGSISLNESDQSFPDSKITQRFFENDNFRFEIPKGWALMETVWGDRYSPRKNYYGFELEEIVSIQNSDVAGQGTAFFSVASSPLAGGMDLADRFTAAYEKPVPAIKNVEKKLYQNEEYSGYEITYDRPWGEPWWRFHDLWLVNQDVMIYVLSFHTIPAEYDDNQEIMKQIINSFTFLN